MQKAKEAEDAEAAAKKKGAEGDLEAKLANAKKIKAQRDAEQAKKDANGGKSSEKGEKKPSVDSADLTAQLKLAKA
jgi:hypothetical protein